MKLKNSKSKTGKRETGFDAVVTNYEKIFYIFLIISIVYSLINIFILNKPVHQLFIITIVVMFIVLNLLVRTKSGENPKSWLGKYIVKTGIPQYENNVIGAVYGGAAFLVLIVGLRGLGKSIPTVLANSKTGQLPSEIIILALGVEFTMVLLLAFIMFFKPEEEVQSNAKPLIEETPCHSLCDVSKLLKTELENSHLDMDYMKSLRDTHEFILELISEKCEKKCNEE